MASPTDRPPARVGDMPLLRSAGRALRRAIALCVLVAIRGRRVLVPVAAALLIGYVALLYVSPTRLPAGPRPVSDRTPVVAGPSGRGVAAPGVAAAGPVAAGSVEAAIREVVERADAEQARAIASGDPAAMRDTATDAYYQESVRANQDLIDGGVRRIALVGIEWGPITVSGDVATAIADESWTTEYADGSTEQSRDRNVYGLVRQDGVWRIQSDEHPGDPSSPPAPAGTSPTGGRADAAPTPATAAAPPPAATIDRARGQSSNWSGYAATGGQFTAVTGTWTVPQPNATDAGGQSAAWVGIGGERSRDLIQAGTEEVVLRPGLVRYEAWIETLPRSPRPVPLAVHPGDVVTVAIAQQDAGSWLVTLSNETTGATYEETVQYDSSLSSAEWIQEAPGGGRRRGTAALDDFGAVTFSRASAVKDGQRVNLAQAGAIPITLTDRADRALAVPSVLTPDSAGFTVTRTSVTPSQGRPGRRS